MPSLTPPTQANGPPCPDGLIPAALGSLAAVSAATPASAVGVFAVIAASVARAAAPPAAFASHLLSVYPDSNAPGPAAVGACPAPLAASRLAFAVAAGTSC